MGEEISSGFDKEFLTITLLTVIAIFLVVALTFKSILIPTILVSIIQTAIFITTGSLGLLGDNVYFLALLVVQAILMGATIDYGILFASYFKEASEEQSDREALKRAYKGSTHTILTSASILFFVTGLLSIIASDPTIVQVLRALAVGTITSTVLVLFVLPSVLVFLRKIIAK
jgi:predicted RND superfamily exporter protein